MVRVRYPGKNDFTIQQMDIHDKPKNAGKAFNPQIKSLNSTFLSNQELPHENHQGTIDLRVLSLIKG